MESQVKSSSKSVFIDWKIASRYARLVASARAVFIQAQNLGANGQQQTLQNMERVYNPSLQDYQTLFSSTSLDACANPNFMKEYDLMYNIVMQDGIVMPGRVQGTEMPAYYGFVAKYKQSPYNYVIVIRGTELAPEWNSDFEDEAVPYAEVQDGGKVVKGFYDLYESARLLVPDGVQSSTQQPLNLKDVAKDPSLALPEAGKYFTVITGHSLGAALTELHAVTTINTSKGACGEVQVYSFAAPNVGDLKFATKYYNTVKENYRVHNKPDLVPGGPLNPDLLDPYFQIADGIEINSEDYPEVFYKTDTDKDKQQSTGCAHVLPTYLYVIEKKAGMDPVPSMLNAMGCSCRSSN